MKSMLLRLPDDLHARVKAKAGCEHRSLNAHVLHLLERDADEGRRYVRRVDTSTGPEWQCEAGQSMPPDGCERHREHWWCETCRGFYGVPHDGIHEGPNAHPPLGIEQNQCACRPCKKATGRA